MNVMNKVRSPLILIMLAIVAPSVNAPRGQAQGFSTQSTSRYGNRLVSPAYTAPADYSQRGGSYWVERDPRYMSALPPKQLGGYGAGYSAPTTAYRPPYAASSYRSCGSGHCPSAAGGGYYGGGTVYRGQGPSVPTGYGRYPAVNYPPVAYPQAKQVFSPYRVPEGYYRGDGIFGKDTVFAENQPVRNFFRYLMP